MLKIRRPLGRLIFNMGIAIPGKTVFLIETAPSTRNTEYNISFGRLWKHILSTCAGHKHWREQRQHDDVIKWKHFPRYWPFVRGIHGSTVNSPHKGQWRGALMFSLICVWINGWVNNREAGDLRRSRAHYDIRVQSERNLQCWHERSCRNYNEKQLVIGYGILNIMSAPNRQISVIFLWSG